MYFANYELHNFMSVKKANINLQNKGLVLIEGENLDADAFDSNGSGKSTIFDDGITWVLYGETVRGLKGDAVVNKFVGKNTMGKLQIVDGEDKYEVIRYRKHKDHKNSVILIHNGKTITSKSDTDTNKAIEDILQMDFLSFTNSVLFGQGSSKMFASSTDSEQKKILERMLQIDVFKACQDLAKEKLSGVEKSRLNVQSDIDLNNKQIDTLRKQIISLQEKEAELETKVAENIKSLTETKDGFTEELEGLSTVDLLEKKKEVQEQIQEIDIQISKLDVYEDYKKELNTNIAVLKREIKGFNSKIEESTTQLEDIIEGKNIPKICKACGQSLPQKDTTAIQRHLLDTITAMEESIKEKQAEIDEYMPLLDNVNKQLESKKPLQKDKDDLEDDLSTINLEVAKIEERMKYLKLQIRTVKNQIKEQEELLSTAYGDLIGSAIHEIEKINSDLEVLEAELEDLNTKYMHINFWVTAFGNQGIKSVLLDSVTPFLNQRANHYLAKLADTSISVEFSTQTELKSGEKRDKFAVEVKNENGHDAYTGSSGGERRRVDIAINMALQDLVLSRSNKKIDLIIMDECYEGLDPVGCELVIQLLKEKAQSCPTILVITHNSHLKDLFDKRIVVSKKNGETRIKYEE